MEEYTSMYVKLICREAYVNILQSVDKYKVTPLRI